MKSREEVKQLQAAAKMPVQNRYRAEESPQECELKVDVLKKLVGPVTSKVHRRNAGWQSTSC